MALGLMAYAVAWAWGGRPERFGTGVLVLSTMLSVITYTWEVDGFYPAGMAQDCARFLIFGWLCLRADRWWLLVNTAAQVLLILAWALRLMDPGFSQLALASAGVGLGYLIDLSVLLGVWERWLAGERAEGPAAWAAAASRRRHKPPAHARG